MEARINHVSSLAECRLLFQVYNEYFTSLNGSLDSFNGIFRQQYKLNQFNVNKIYKDIFNSWFLKQNLEIV